MAEPGLIDITQPLSSTLPGWPGDTPFSAARVCAIGPGNPVNIARFTCSTHAGTHADAPLHYDPDGAAIDAVALQPYVGPARLADLRGHRRITPELVAPLLATPVTRLLVRTYERFPHRQWDAAFATIDPATIALLAAHGVLLIGVDTPSLDPQTAKVLHAHEAAKAANMRILEGLVLDDVAAGDYELIALPLRLAGLDAAPVRAILRPLPR